MELSLKEKREYCIAHYVKRGYTREQADEFTSHKEEEIQRLYDYVLWFEEELKNAGPYKKSSPLLK